MIKDITFLLQDFQGTIIKQLIFSQNLGEI